MELNDKMNGNHIERKDSRIVKKDYRLIDIAWDKFSDYIGEKELQTPLSLEQFEEIFEKIDKNGKLSPMKEDILRSLQNDCYAWPLVEKK